MSIIYVLIPLAIIIVAIAIAVFFWAVKSDQFNDLDRQGYNILFDEDIKQGNMKENQAEKDDSSATNSNIEKNSQQQSSSSNHAR